MSRKATEAAVIPTLLVSLCTGAQVLSANTQDGVSTFDKVDSHHEISTLKTETVQLLELKNSPGKLMVNVAGDPGVHFQVKVSPTGKEGTYSLIDGGESVIGKNSFVSLILDLKALDHDELFLSMFSNDDGDFTKIGRTIAEPIALSTSNKISILDVSNDDDDDDDYSRRTVSMGVRG